MSETPISDEEYSLGVAKNLRTMAMDFLTRSSIGYNAVTDLFADCDRAVEYIQSGYSTSDSIEEL